MDKGSLFRCSSAVRSLGHLPIGSAASRTSFLLVDVPLPWGRDIADVESLAPVGAAIARAAERGERWRLQGMVPPDGAARRRVIAHQLPDHDFDRYRRFALEVEPAEVVEAAVALVEAPRHVMPESGGQESELLVCTHGRRDACCGSSGTALWRDLEARPDLLPPTTHLCRTSHTGGHRFAPTVIHLPTGTTWAWLDADSVGVVTGHTEPFAAVADRYRGSCALNTAAEQVLEHAVLCEVGWSWFENRRSGWTLDDAGRRVARLRYETPEGASGVWSAEIDVVGRAPVPDCGAPLESAPKFEEVLAIVPGTLDHATAVGGPSLSPVEI